MEGHESIGMLEQILAALSFTASKLCCAVLCYTVLFSRVRLETSALPVPNDGNPASDTANITCLLSCSFQPR